MILIEINDEHDRTAGVRDKIERAVTIVLSDAKIANAQISVAIVDDATIQRLNRQYLEHDYPTDVLSFTLDSDDGRVDGEIIASADTAQRVAPDHGWSADHELLLYVVHGALHLAGFDDSTADGRRQMRRRESEVLEPLGAVVPEASKAAVSTSVDGSLTAAGGGSVS